MTPRAALLTPAGRGAVAVVRVWGNGAASAIRTCFHSATGRDPGAAEVGCILFGRWRRPGATSGAHDAGEELIVCRCGAEEFEIHCHGGDAASAAVLAALVEQGAVVVGAPDYLAERHCDRIAVEALEHLQRARTTRAAAILLDQYAGALRHEIMAVTSLLEAGNDLEARRRLELLVERSAVGLRLVDPFRIVIAGPPNVGKSSLLNALVGYERAIVFDRPGTTRDVVTASAALDGWPVEFADTAGLRETADELEAAGIDAATRRRAAADLTLLVFDLTQPWTNDDDALVAANPTALIVMNKLDRRNSEPIRILPSPLAGEGPGVRGPARVAQVASQPGPHSSPASRIQVSALTKQGLDELIAAIVAKLVPQVPPPNAAVPFTQRQVAQLRQAFDSLNRNNRQAAIDALNKGDGSLCY